MKSLITITCIILSGFALSFFELDKIVSDEVIKYFPGKIMSVPESKTKPNDKTREVIKGKSCKSFSNENNRFQEFFQEGIKFSYKPNLTFEMRKLLLF